MGRPLFSTIVESEPVVRVEPEIPEHIIPEKWSHRNPFDPDADEFFDDAVFEAFIDPSTLTITNPLDDIPSDPSAIPLEGSPISTVPVSEATTPSGSPDPTAVMPLSAYRQTLVFDPRLPTPDPLALQAFPESYRLLNGEPMDTDHIPRSSPSITRRRSATVTTSAERSIPHIPGWSDAQLYLQSQVSSRPNPRLYSWAQAISQSPPQSPSFADSSSSGPLTNPSARMSLAHIAPSRIRVQDVFTFT